MSRGAPAPSRTVGIGIVGSRFIARAHAESLRRFVPAARLVAVASPTQAHRDEFAREFAVPHACADYRELLADRDVDAVIIGAPNIWHARMALDAAAAGKHVIIEKPLAVTLDEADRMIAACAEAGVKLMYAENLVFAPKYERARRLIEEGALGRLYLVKQLEKHSGPHAAWFWDVDQAGGGVLMDMGCHGIEFARWLYGKPPLAAVTAHCATVRHAERTRGDDNCIVLLEFEDGGLALIDDSWAFFGGMDDRAELYGTEGSVQCDVVHGIAMKTYSNVGYGYAMEKAASTKGYTFTIFEEGWNYGFPQELAHFVDCIRFDRAPRESGEDGREVLRIMFAAYESAATGRRIEMKGYKPRFPSRPVESWLRRPNASGAALSS
ncbi:MAG TPA: Gfo/Idh/MocA family oxidoreductase [Terriglobales bacterium]|nr:Gfo/Idh/MocA family oxidoreductase [Terriglobales bacterium]